MIFKGVPKNFGYVITVTTLGLVLLSILIFIYSVFVSTKTVGEEQAAGNAVDGSIGMDTGVVSPPDEYPRYLLPEQSDSSAKDESEQKLVKTGNFDITVDDFDDVSGSVRQTVKELGGFVVSTNDKGVSINRTLTMSVKVPASSFDMLVEKIKGYATVVNSFNENTADVTRTYQDLQARLKNEKALEVKLLEILDKATKVSEILEVQRTLSQTQQNIEMLESQIKYYDAQIDMSTVTITMNLSSEALNVTGDKWQPMGVFREALSSLVGLGKDLGTLAIWTVVFSPVLALLYYAFRWFSKRVTIK